MRTTHITVGVVLAAVAAVAGQQLVAQSTASDSGYCRAQTDQRPAHPCLIHYHGTLISPARAERIQNSSREGGAVLAPDGVHLFDSDAALNAFERARVEQPGP